MIVLYMRINPKIERMKPLAKWSGFWVLVSLLLPISNASPTSPKYHLNSTSFGSNTYSTSVNTSDLTINSSLVVSDTSAYSSNYGTTFSISANSAFSTSTSTTTLSTSTSTTTFSTSHTSAYSTNYTSSFSAGSNTSYNTYFVGDESSFNNDSTYFTTDGNSFTNDSTLLTNISASYSTSISSPVESTTYKDAYSTTFTTSTNSSFVSIDNGTSYKISYSASYNEAFSTSPDNLSGSTNTSTVENAGVWAWLKNRFLGVLENYSIISPRGAKSTSEDSAVEVTLNQGVIIGVKEKIPEAGDRVFYSFKGIPYAEPPVGNLRFKEPVPASSWSGKRNASIAFPMCPQITLQSIIAMGSEDCLYLNVYTPRITKSDLPVMVFIHGGIFLAGGLKDSSPLPLLTKDIVLVTIQYRLGTLGFLSTEDSVLPGNMGLKDQTLALQWVKNNINFLGGNPNNITLFGTSAGAASVHFQILSPKARGLFQQAIMQSGSALSPWAVRKNHRQVAVALAQRYNCFNGSRFFNSQELLNCLQRLPVTDLVSIPYLTQNYKYLSLVNVMAPRVDGNFLPKHPATLLREGNYTKVNIISGVNKHEGASIGLPILYNEMVLNEVLDKFEITAPPIVLVDEEDSPIDLAHQIFHYYFRGGKISIESAEVFIDMISDASYKVDHDEVVQILTGDTLFGFKTYSYEFQYKGQYSSLGKFVPSATSKWANHGDELIYLFSQEYILNNPEDLHIQEVMVNLWTNFAITGNPTPNNSLGFQWVPVTPTCLHYLAIDKVPRLQEFNRAPILEFWRSLSMEVNHLLNPPLKWMSIFPRSAVATPPVVQQCGN